MIYRTLIIALSCLVASCSVPPTAHAKSTAPITIKHNAPKAMQTGDKVTTVIQFIAGTDLQKLVVSVSPYSGIELVSGQGTMEFLELRRGETREINVQVQLTDDEVGYLSVFATTTNALGVPRTKSIVIRYGTTDAITRQKMRSKNIAEDAKGDKLILMPGSPR